MEIICGGIDKFKDVKNNAYWANVHLDTPLKPDISYVASYKAHLNDRINNPTIGALANHKYINGKAHDYPADFYRNRNTIEADAGIMQLKRVLETKIQKDYPKTRKIREYIIAENRLHLDFVKKIIRK